MPKKIVENLEVEKGDEPKEQKKGYFKKRVQRIRKFKKKKIIIDHQYRPNRYPTDVLCLLLFVAFWMGMGVVAVLAIERGNPRTLVLPTDFENNICGEYNEATNRSLQGKDYLWYPFSIDVAEPDNSRLFDAFDMGICVSHCPNASVLSALNAFQSANPLDILTLGEGSIVCEYDLQDSLSLVEKIQMVQANLVNGSENTGCYLNWLPTEVINRRCFPDFTSQEVNMTEWAQFVFQYLFYAGSALKAGYFEVQASYLLLIINVFIVIFMCFALLCIVQMFIKIFVYGTLYILFFALGAFAAYSGWVGYRKYINSENTDDTTWAWVWMIVGGSAGILELIYLVVMIFMLNRIGIAMEIIRIAATPIKTVFWIAVVPAGTFLACAGITVYWVWIAAYIQSAKIPVEINGADLQALSEYVALNVSVSNSTTVVSSDTIIQAFQWYHLFGYFWTIATIMAVGYAIVAGVITNWYFSSHRDNKKVGIFPIIRSAGRVVIYHLGSLIFGALLVAIIQIIRVIAWQIEQYLKRTKQENKVTKAIFKVLHVVLWLCKKFLEWFNKNAYIMMMVHGSGYICSSVRAVNLIVQNVLVIGTVNFIGDFMLLLAQIGLTVLGTIATYFLVDIANDVVWLNWLIYLAPNTDSTGNDYKIKYAIVPIVFGCVISFIISGLFINIYSTAIDTILLCYCEDKNVNNGSKERPYYMPDSLRAKLGVDRHNMHAEEFEISSK